MKHGTRLSLEPERVMIKAALSLAICAGAAAATAHDTWFRALPGDRPGDAVLLLGTGNRFPVQEYAVGAEHLRRSGCRSGTLAGTLQPVQLMSKALLLRGAALRPTGAPPAPLTCWAQLVPFDVELSAELVNVYLDDIAAPAAVRDAWAAMQSRGVRWKERFTKHARIEVGAAATPSAAALPTPTDMGMDVLLESGVGIARQGDLLSFRVLRDGRPLADFAVELRSEGEAAASWLKTDAEGRVAWPPPAPGNWVLRGTDLRVSEASPDAWESRFVTLAFAVAAPIGR